MISDSTIRNQLPKLKAYLKKMGRADSLVVKGKKVLAEQSKQVKTKA